MPNAIISFLALHSLVFAAGAGCEGCEASDHVRSFQLLQTGHGLAASSQEQNATEVTEDETIDDGSEHSRFASFASPALSDIGAIVINLDRRPDRMQGCIERLQARIPWLSYRRFSASDGDKDPLSEAEVVKVWNTGRNVVYQKQRSIREGWNDLATYTVRDVALSLGERGTAVTHVRAWRHCLEQAGGTERPLLVLEDDAAPTAQFTATLERAIAATPQDAHVLYLGYSQAADWRRDVSPDVVEAEYVWTTVAYVLWPAGARILLSRLPVDQPVDNFMAAACAERSVRAYCVRPSIVQQNGAWDTNSDVVHSDEHFWLTSQFLQLISTVHNRLRYFQGKISGWNVLGADTRAESDTIESEEHLGGW